MAYLMKDLLIELTNYATDKTGIIKKNRTNLSEYGDIYLPANITLWKDVLVEDYDSQRIYFQCDNILQYYFFTKIANTPDLSDQQITDKAISSLISASKNWNVQFEKVVLRNERVCFHMNRFVMIGNWIREAIQCQEHFGKFNTNGKRVNLLINEDADSNLTTSRLKVTRRTCEELLKFHGYSINQMNPDHRCILTTKSQGIVDRNVQKIHCGVVKNPTTNSKDTKYTWEMYLDLKIKELDQFNEKIKEFSDDNADWNEKLADAMIKFDFLSVNPTQNVFIKNQMNSQQNQNKIGIFILYNFVRVSTILDKFSSKIASGEYPAHVNDIDKIDFTKLSLEREWELIYHFVFGYKDLIFHCIQRENDSFHFRPHTLCIFLSQWAQKFSAYYHHTRILTERKEHLLSTMMARIYLLKALEVVIRNIFRILNIVPMSRM